MEQRRDHRRQLGAVERGATAPTRARRDAACAAAAVSRIDEQLVVERFANARVADDGVRGLAPLAELAAEAGERLHGAAIAGLDLRDLLVGVRRGRACRRAGRRRDRRRRSAGARLRARRRPAQRSPRGRRCRASVKSPVALRERLQLVLDQLVARRERERAREIGERAGARRACDRGAAGRLRATARAGSCRRAPRRGAPAAARARR